MKLLSFITVSLIPTVVSSVKCNNPELVCIELCCEKTEVYDVASTLCKDIPKEAKASWHSILYENELISREFEIVEYGECNSAYAFIPVCYSPQYDKESNQTKFAVMSKVPCHRVAKLTAFMVAISVSAYFVLPICLPIMAIYTCTRKQFIAKLFSGYLGSIVLMNFIMLFSTHYWRSIKLEDREHFFKKSIDIGAYFHISSFIWQNVIAFQIWWAFKGENTADNSDKVKRRFLFYSIYVWGIAAILWGCYFLLQGTTWLLMFKKFKWILISGFNFVTFLFLSVNICLIRCRVAHLTNEDHFKLKLTICLLRLGLVLGLPRIVLIFIYPYSHRITGQYFLLEPVLLFLVVVWEPKKCCNKFRCCCCRKAEEVPEVVRVTKTTD